MPISPLKMEKINTTRSGCIETLGGKDRSKSILVSVLLRRFVNRVVTRVLSKLVYAKIKTRHTQTNTNNLRIVKHCSATVLNFFFFATVYGTKTVVIA